MNLLLKHRMTLPLTLLLLVLLILSPQLYLLLHKTTLPVFVQQGLLPALLLLLLLLSVSRNFATGIWFWLPFALLAPQELFYLSTYQKVTDAHAMAIIAETDLAEAAGYLSGLGWLILPAILLVLMLVAVASAVCKVQALQWPRYGRPLVWLLTLCWLGWLYQQELVYRELYPVKEGRNATETELSKRPLPNSHNLYHQSYPLNLLLAANEFRVQKAALAEVAATVADFRFGTSQPQNTAERQIYVLVIGETLRPDRLQLNGYPRATTPRLAGLGDVVSFTNMVSPWAWTRMSVPVILSRKSAQDHSYFSRETSVVAAFKEAGFATAWLSTQSPLGVHDSSVALHASEADEVQYLNPVGYKKEGFYDDVLVGAFSRVLEKGEAKQLIVLHTLGSHFSYSDRYPDSFDLFQPSGKGEALGMHDRANKEKLNNAYDNTVAYTDYLLFNLIRQLEKQQAISSLLLVSDHGENLFDGDCDKSGHGHNTEFDYRVAALWWGSAEFKAKYPQQTQLLQQRRDVPLITSQTFHTMLDLAQLRYADERLAQSFASTQFVPPQRILASGIDFDKAQRLGACKVLPNPVQP
ncbi:phosphoethanolamine transferase [Rheinheimera sp. 4Y26]|uniref:phosphoethanolamine transferase n=1 Tax=Rheinheimera sp. 4Y26 TaxID=2977811 RepID=UPI0021B0E117|nr:phosphoethanolamine transferase [Rheinheimera sp. 4Y26]MCT6698673.1 lipid A phosphoethanolamine transferase [Rheinheimera sp. 4Y26]